MTLRRPTPAETISRIPLRTVALGAEANYPAEHFHQSVALTLAMVDQACGEGLALPEALRLREQFVETERARYRAHLRNLALVALVEAFERFLKELAAACINQVAPYTLDNRFDDDFPVSATTLATYFEEGSVGAALCEPATWMRNRDINARFGRILRLADPKAAFELFPQKRADDLGTPVAILWQLRHTIVHNVGVITRSDARKLRLLTRGDVRAPSMLAVRENDLRATREFLDEAVSAATTAVAARLGEVLTELVRADPRLFDAGRKAQEIATLMYREVTVGGQTRSPEEVDI